MSRNVLALSAFDERADSSGIEQVPAAAANDDDDDDDDDERERGLVGWLLGQG
jgi:hypothetical protein